ncbi:hypothetical protein AMECASPLE_028271 [Ameca splendens]|uniref:Uncharacterized protein n=1 Tax=Ameca splendens TaxID=208324 RepID=A0ABV0XID8_9TELE
MYSLFLSTGTDQYMFHNGCEHIFLLEIAGLQFDALITETVTSLTEGHMKKCLEQNWAAADKGRPRPIAWTGTVHSRSKSEAMLLEWKRVACPLQAGGEFLPQVEEFKYLGSCSPVRGEWSGRSTYGSVLLPQ